MISIMLVKCFYSFAKHLSFFGADSFENKGSIVVEKEKLTRTTASPLTVHTVVYYLLVIFVGSQFLTYVFDSIEFSKFVEDVGSVCCKLHTKVG